MKPQWVIPVSVVVWITLVAAGEIFLLNFNSTPGVRTASPQLWPQESQLTRSKTLPTLLVFAHPKCPCTRATIGELSKIMTHSQGKVSVYVLFNKPTSASDDWLKTDIWKMASNIPGVRVLEDAGGLEASRFHSQTSGQTILYDTEGRLLFEGGITASRGHFGDNLGSQALKRLIAQGRGTGTAPSFSVFGCPLFNLNRQKGIAT